MRGLLASRGVPEGAVERTLAALELDGYLDDEKLAREFITARASRLGHGRARLLLDLERRGVAPATARAAWDRLVADGDLAPADLVARAVARRLASHGPLAERECGRLHAALLRAGFDDDEIRAELEPHRPAGDEVDAGRPGD
jgi:SOS response regulatory protein OraA/RecX